MTPLVMASRGRSCATCDCWEPPPDEKTLRGECRAYAAPAMMGRSVDGQDVVCARTTPDFWCAQWKPKPVGNASPLAEMEQFLIWLRKELGLPDDASMATVKREMEVTFDSVDGG